MMNQTRNNQLTRWGSFSNMQGQGDGDTRTNLIINYLPQNMLDVELEQLFSRIGPVDSVHIARDNGTGYSYGFGFVNYKYHGDAERAIESLNGFNIENKRLKVAFAKPANEYSKDTNVYVSNLPHDINNNKLDEIFGKFGNIIQKNILRDKHTGKPRGVAFIRFEKKENAQQAILEMNGRRPNGCIEPLNVKMAEIHARQKMVMMMDYSQTYQRGFQGPNPGALQHKQIPPLLFPGNFGPPTQARNNFNMAGGGGPMRGGRKAIPRNQFGNYNQQAALREYNPIGTGGGYMYA